MLDVPAGTPIVARYQVTFPKPNPDLFLAAAERLGAEPRDCFVIGDSVRDMLAARRAGALRIGVLSGGYGKEELQEAGPYRVYDDPAHLLAHLDELGSGGPASSASLQSVPRDRYNSPVPPTERFRAP